MTGRVVRRCGEFAVRQALAPVGLPFELRAVARGAVHSVEFLAAGKLLRRGALAAAGCGEHRERARQADSAPAERKCCRLQSIGLANVTITPMTAHAPITVMMPIL